MNTSMLDIALQEGEGLKIEFKEQVSNNFGREIVAFANTVGGTIYVGVGDDNVIKGIEVSNKLKVR